MAAQTQGECRTMTVEEAAVQLGVSRSTAYEAVKKGELPTLKVGRRLLVPIAQLRRMLGEDHPQEQRPGGNRDAAERTTADVSDRALPA